MIITCERNIMIHKSYTNQTIKMVKSKRVQVSFTKQQWQMIETLRGEMGDNDADIVRNIVLAWLAEKSFVTDTTKLKLDKLKNQNKI